MAIVSARDCKPVALLQHRILVCKIDITVCCSVCSFRLVAYGGQAYLYLHEYTATGGCSNLVRWLYCMECPQYSIRLEVLSMHKQFTSYIRRVIASSDSIVDIDWQTATEWCKRHLWCYQPSSDIAENFWKFLVRNVQARGMTSNWFKW